MPVIVGISCILQATGLRVNDDVPRNPVQLGSSRRHRVWSLTRVETGMRTHERGIPLSTLCHLGRRHCPDRERSPRRRDGTGGLTVTAGVQIPTAVIEETTDVFYDFSRWCFPLRSQRTDSQLLPRPPRGRDRSRPCQRAPSGERFQPKSMIHARHYTRGVGDAAALMRTPSAMNGLRSGKLKSATSYWAAGRRVARQHRFWHC